MTFFSGSEEFVPILLTCVKNNSHMKNAWAQITLTSEDLVLTPRTREELAPTSRTCEELVPTNKHLVLSSATGVRLYFFFFQKLYPMYIYEG